MEAAPGSSNVKPAPDQVLTDIADYVLNYKVADEKVVHAARLCMTDALACALDALDYPECTKLLGPIVPGTIVPKGARVPGTQYELDPETAAFSFGCMIRWLDYNDTFNGAAGSHPSDNLAGILMLADHLSRHRVSSGGKPLLTRDVLAALVKAYEIQGCISIENGFMEAAKMDQDLLTRVASSAVLTYMLGGSREQIINAVSNSFICSSLTVFRIAPNTGWRKSWACAEASSQAMRLASMALKGEMGYPSVLTAKPYGFYAARYNGNPFKFQRPYGDYVIQNTNFKVVAAGMHSQTATECAFQLHPLVRHRIDDIERIDVRAQHFLIVVMHKTGPLYNPADRDHCAEYIIAIGLLHGKLEARDYEDDVAADPRIDILRGKMVLVEDAGYTQAFNDPAKRANPCSIQVWFKDGASTPKIEIEYPAGHARRRADVIPVLRAKLALSLKRRFVAEQCQRILELCDDARTLDATPVNKFVDMMVIGAGPYLKSRP